MDDARKELVAAVESECACEPGPDGAQWTEYLQVQPGVRAVLYYGSGSRSDRQSPQETVEDFYLLVSSYRDYGSGPMLAMAGSCLPPNVYYYERDFGAGVRRCKCAVLRTGQFLRAARGHSFTPHIWARFAQPFRITYADTEALRQAVVVAGAAAVGCLLRRGRTVADAASRMDAASVWVAGLRSTYADELRSEPPGYITRLYAANAPLFEHWTQLAGVLEVRDVGVRSPSSLKWRQLSLRLARPLRKGVVALRLMKSAFTFSGGLAYAQWKVERHSGRRIELSDFDRRHPLLGGIRLFYRVYRERALR